MQYLKSSYDFRFIGKKITTEKQLENGLGILSFAIL